MGFLGKTKSLMLTKAIIVQLSSLRAASREDGRMNHVGVRTIDFAPTATNEQDSVLSFLVINLFFHPNYSSTLSQP